MSFLKNNFFIVIVFKLFNLLMLKIIFLKTTYIILIYF